MAQHHYGNGWTLMEKDENTIGSGGPTTGQSERDPWPMLGRLGGQLKSLEDGINGPEGIREKVARLDERSKHAATKNDVSQVGTKLAEAETRLIRWMIGTMVVVGGIIIAILRLWKG